MLNPHSTQNVYFFSKQTIKMDIKSCNGYKYNKWQCFSFNYIQSSRFNRQLFSKDETVSSSKLNVPVSNQLQHITFPARKPPSLLTFLDFNINARQLHCQLSSDWGEELVYTNNIETCHPQRDNAM